MRFDEGRVISNFIFQALNDQKITIYGYGSQTRSFCYVDDLINGMFFMQNGNLKTINIYKSNEISIK